MMMEEEEDIIFDQAALLPGSDERESPRVATPRSAGRILITVCLFAAFFGLGLCIAIPGPTLLDLQEQTNTDTQEISRIFTGRSVGYLVGSIIGGFLFDRLNQSCLLWFSLLLSAISIAAAPWCKNFILLVSIMAFQGVSMGFLDTGGNVLCLYTWGRDSGPYMQAMHCLFGVGAFVAPLIAEPFLSHPFNNTNLTIYNETTVTPSLGEQNIIMKRDWSDTLQNLLDSDTNSRHKRDEAPVDGMKSTILAFTGNDTTPAPTPKLPTKPKVVDAQHLDSDPSVADGSKTAHEIKVMQANVKPTPVPTPPTPPPPDEIEINGTMGNETVEDIESPPSTTTATTTSTTTTTLPPTTTTTTTTTTRPPTQPYNSPKSPALDNETSLNENTTDISEPSTFDKIIDRVTGLFTVINGLSKVQFAYLVIAGFNLLVSFMFLVTCCRGGLRLKATKNENTESFTVVNRENQGFRVQILILLFVFYFLYVGMEVTYGGLVMTFAVKFLRWSKARGTLLTSVFWGTFATGRGLAIFLARCLSPAIMLIIDLVIVIFALIGLVMASETNNTVMWVCTGMLGIGMASIFPTGITWAERYIHVTGKATAFFVVGSALGEMSFPALSGFLFEAKGPMWLLYTMLAAAIFSIVIYIVMQNLATNMGERYKRLETMPHSMHYGGSDPEEVYSDDLEMDALTPSNSTYSDDLTLQRRKRVTFNLNGVHNHKNGVIIPSNLNHVTNGGVFPRPSILKTKATMS